MGGPERFDQRGMDKEKREGSPGRSGPAGVEAVRERSGFGQLQVQVVVGDLQGLLGVEGVAGEGAA